MADVEDTRTKLTFFALMRRVHRYVTKLPGYSAFLGRWICLEMVCALGKLALPLFILCCHGLLSDLVDDIDVQNPKLPGPSDMHPGLLIGAALMGLFQIGGMIAPVFRNSLVDDLKEDFKTQQAVGVVKKVFLLPHDTHISTPTGEFPQLLGKVFQLDGIFTNLYTTVFPTAFEFGMALVILFIMFSGLVGVAGFTVAALYIPLALTVILGGYCRLRYNAAVKKSAGTKGAMKGMMTEWGNLMAVVQSYEQAHFFGNVDYEVGRAQSSFERIVKDIKKFTQIDWESVGLNMFGTIAVFSLGGVVVLHFAYGTGDLLLRALGVAALVKYLLTFPAMLMMLGVAVGGLRSAASEYEVLHEFLDRASDTADLPEAKPLQLEPNGGAPKIEFRNVTFAYPAAAQGATTANSSSLPTPPTADNLILDDVSFTVPPGQIAGFVGASGCGKSTMLRLIMRLYAPQKGQILVNDQDIKFVTGESLRKAFSVVTQNAKLANGSLRENVDYGKMWSSDREIIEACKTAELNLADLVEEEVAAEGEKAEDHPQPTELRALDRKCGETGAKLSGGQQQRVALARALLKNGSVFLLDEPTAALDNKVSRELMRTMAAIQENEGSAAGRKTLLHITHRLEELKQADQIFYLKGGGIVERGTWAELVGKEGGLFAEQVKAKVTSEE